METSNEIGSGKQIMMKLVEKKKLFYISLKIRSVGRQARFKVRCLFPMNQSILNIFVSKILRYVD